MISVYLLLDFFDLVEEYKSGVAELRRLVCKCHNLPFLRAIARQPRQSGICPSVPGERWLYMPFSIVRRMQASYVERLFVFGEIGVDYFLHDMRVVIVTIGIVIVHHDDSDTFCVILQTIDFV